MLCLVVGRNGEEREMGKSLRREKEVINMVDFSVLFGIKEREKK